MKSRFSIVNLRGPLMASFIAAVALLDAAAPTPFDAECEAISMPEQRPCSLLINRPQNPDLPSE